MRRLLSIILLFVSGCSSCDKEPPIDGRTSVCSGGLISSAKKDISAKKYNDAIQKCERAEKLCPNHDEAPYCVLVGNVGALVQSLSSVISLLASQADAPPNYTPAIDGKALLNAVMSEIEGQMAYIDSRAYVLAGMENPHFQIDDFVLGLDPADLLKLLGSNSEIKIDGELAINLKGTWDKSEVLLLGAAVNGVQGILDYLFAHSLIIDSTDYKKGCPTSDLCTEGIANFLLGNPKLLQKDTMPEDAGRIPGDENYKGLKNDFLAALSYAVGRDVDLEKVSPKNGGLVEAIQASAAENRPDAIVRWVGAADTGIPTKIGIPAIADLKESVSGITIPAEFENPLKPETWYAMIALGKAMRDNIEKGGDTVSIQAPAQAVINDIRVKYADDLQHIRILAVNRPVPNVIGLNPHAFFENPKYVRELLPYYFTYQYGTADTEPVRADIAYEIEKYVDGIDNINEKLGLNRDATANDFAHFEYAAGDVIDASHTVRAYTFPTVDFTAPPAATTPDSIVATAKVPNIVQIAVQDPTLGGMLMVDLAGFSGAGGLFAPLTNQGLNEGIGKILHYYCLDTTHDGLDIIKDEIYGAANKIADCTYTGAPGEIE